MCLSNQRGGVTVAKIITKARKLRLDYQAKLGRPVPMQEVAEATGISQAALSNLELGKTGRIDFDTLQKLCIYYGVGVGDLLELDPNGQQTPGLAAAFVTA
jgi:DNA-binding Xre family transcriptional regulator